MARIVLAAIGSLGDLHPVIAIGRALAAAGHHPVLAWPEDGVAKVSAAGLEDATILPSYASICARLGLTVEETAARVLADTNSVVDQILLPSLAESTAALAAPIVAEKRTFPLASVVLQPMTLFSAWQPPRAPRFEPFRHAPQGPLGRGWNRLLYAGVRVALRHRHVRAIDAVRRIHGLPPSGTAPLIDHCPATAAILCCWSAALGALPSDAPALAALTGFPFFDGESGADDACPASSPPSSTTANRRSCSRSAPSRSPPPAASTQKPPRPRACSAAARSC